MGIAGCGRGFESQRQDKKTGSRATHGPGQDKEEIKNPY
jgi:hypothetical protein